MLSSLIFSEVDDMNKTNKLIWGIILIVLGLVFALNAVGITDLNLFFNGWWTLIIIIPCLVGLITERDKTGNLIGLVIGVLLLLRVRRILTFSLLWKIAVPVIVVIIGVKMIFSAFFGDKAYKMVKEARMNEGGNFKEVNATFSGNKVSFAGEVFDAVELNAVFGGVECDLRGAVIEKDCSIEANAVFGGIDILVPNNINVKINSTSIFGGTSDKRGNAKIEGAPTLYVNSNAMFGGVEIK